MVLPEKGCWDPLLPLVWLLGFRVLVPVVGPTSVTFGFSEATLCKLNLDRVSRVCQKNSSAGRVLQSCTT